MIRDAALAAFKSTATQVLQAIDDPIDPPPRTAPSLQEQEVAILDASALEEAKGRTEAAAWRFTSTGSVLIALDPAERSDERAKAVTSAAPLVRAYAAVLEVTDRAMPKRSAGGRYDGGFIEGRLHVVDTEHHRSVCATPLVAESSKVIETLKVGLKFGPKVALGGDLEKDFAANYAKAVETKLAEMTDGKLSVRF